MILALREKGNSSSNWVGNTAAAMKMALRAI
jgi:hypothetical protein